MTLYQLLRVIDQNIGVVLFDMNNHVLEEASNKNLLSLTYYESAVYRVTIPFINSRYEDSILIILIE